MRIRFTCQHQVWTDRYLSTMRSFLRMAGHEWQRIGKFPQFRLLNCDAEQDRWLTHEEAERLTAAVRTIWRPWYALRLAAVHPRLRVWN